MTEPLNRRRTPWILTTLVLASFGCNMNKREDAVQPGALVESNTGIEAKAVDSMVKPPVAKSIPDVQTIHDDQRVDHYSWMKEKESPEVIAHLHAEEAYAEAQMAHTKGLQEEIYEEMLGRIKQTDDSVPYRDGDYFYYSRTEEGKQYRIYCRKRGSLDAAEEVILDVNELAEGQPFMAVGTMQVSPDSTRLAFTTDNNGFREYTLHVKDLTSGRVSTDRALKVKSVAWANDDRLYYTTDDEAKRSYRVYSHELASTFTNDEDDGSARPDELIFQEDDERFGVYVWRSRSERFVFLGSESHTTSEIRCLDLQRAKAGFHLIAEREQDHEYSVEHHGDHFIIRTNDEGINFRVVRAAVSSPGRSNWEELLPHDDKIMRSSVSCFRDHMVVREREGGLPHLRFVHMSTGAIHRMEFPEPVYSVYGATNAEFDTTTFRYTYQSMTTPRTVYDYDMDARTQELLKQTEVLGGYDPNDYESQRISAQAADGTEIPISMVYRKNIKPRGGNPLLLNGYGAYGFGRDASFSSARLSLLDRGAIFAVAHIRGGGEMGKAWHDGGRMFQKMNSFTDFIACADHLVAEGYTSRDKLVIEGGSAGGLLMGAVTNLRPDLCKAVISHVPFVDVINTMLDEELPLTVGEFEEWGNPKIKEQYFAIKEYCPYTNLEAKDYPTILMKTSYNDSQVMYWEPAKYVARLRELRTDDNLLLFKVNMEGGHGGASGRYDRLRDTAFDYSFFLWQTESLPDPR